MTLARIGEPGQKIADLLDGVMKAMFKLTQGILLTAPFAVAAIIAYVLASQGIKLLLAMGKLLLTLLPLVLIGSALITALAAGAKSMKEAQSHIMWLMMLPMLPAYGLMAYPIKDTALWQYAVPFLSQNQLIMKVTRSESATWEQWGVYFATSLALGVLLWCVAVWRYRQEKLAISA